MKKDRDFKSVEEEKELDDIFFSKDNKLEKAIKKAKRHSIIRTAIISLIVVVVVAITSNILFSELVYRMEGNVQISVSRFNEISAPNNFIGKTSRYHDYLRGRTTYTTYKLLEGKVVYTGVQEYHYGVFSNHQGNLIGTESPSILGYSWDEEDLKERRYNELGQREMVFFYPYVDYSMVLKDLQILEDISDDKYMEFAISFNQAYTIDEVRALIPEDVTIAWYWVDDIKEEYRKQLQAYEQEQAYSNGETYDMYYPAKIRSERTAYGIKAYNQHGELYENPKENFIRAIEQGKEQKSRYQNQFNELFETLQGENGMIDESCIKILGVVVTGDKKSLENLKELQFIRASSIGVVTDKY